MRIVSCFHALARYRAGGWGIKGLGARTASETAAVIQTDLLQLGGELEMLREMLVVGSLLNPRITFVFSVVGMFDGHAETAGVAE